MSDEIYETDNMLLISALFIGLLAGVIIGFILGSSIEGGGFERIIFQDRIKEVEVDGGLADAIEEQNYLKRIELKVDSLIKCTWADLDSDCKEGYRERKLYEDT